MGPSIHSVPKTKVKKLAHDGGLYNNDSHNPEPNRQVNPSVITRRYSDYCPTISVPRHEAEIEVQLTNQSEKTTI